MLYLFNKKLLIGITTLLKYYFKVELALLYYFRGRRQSHRLIATIYFHTFVERIKYEIYYHFGHSGQ